MQLASPTSGLTPAPARPMLPVMRARLVSAATAPVVNVYWPLAGKTMVDGGKPPSGRSTCLPPSTASSEASALSVAPLRVVGRLLGCVGSGSLVGPVLRPPVA